MRSTKWKSGMAAVAVMWITGGCERANPNYVGDMAGGVVLDLTSGTDMAGGVMLDLTNGTDLANGPLCGQTTGMVQVTGGTFRMGEDQPDMGIDVGPKSRPAHIQTVAGFWMDETEVTVDAYGRCVAAGACTAAGGKEVSPLCNIGTAGREQHPINCVDLYQAQAYCQWQCKRLPTEIEWEYAARGAPASLYPWGNNPPNTANKSETDLCWKMSNGTCEIKSHPQSSTLLGAVAGVGMYDLAGNVWEWTTSYYSCDFPLNKDNPADPVKCGQINNTSFRIVRGGSFGDRQPTNVRAAYRSYGVSPTNRSNDIGFRCLRAL